MNCLIDRDFNGNLQLTIAYWINGCKITIKFQQQLYPLFATVIFRGVLPLDYYMTTFCQLLTCEVLFVFLLVSHVLLWVSDQQSWSWDSALQQLISSSWPYQQELSIFLMFICFFWGHFLLKLCLLSISMFFFIVNMD